MNPNPTIFITGDSLSAPHYSWAKQMEELYVCNVQVQARGGLRMIDFTLPDWWTGETSAQWEPDVICFYLGANDGIKGSPIAEFESRFHQNLYIMRQLIDNTQAQGDELKGLVIKPPTYDYDLDLRERMRPYRQIVLDAEGLYPDIEFANMPWGDYSNLEDRYHPDAALHCCQGIHIAQEVLGLTARANA